jgi:hypothetical protein
MSDATRPTACAGCGFIIEGGTAGCRAKFDELLARDFGDALYFRVHRKMVDTYCLQHPDEYCASAKSLAAHLAGLSWFIDNTNVSAAIGPEALHKWLNGRKDLVKPEVPAFRGSLTIGHIERDSDPVEYAQAVDRWARATWEAYAALQGLAGDWMRQAQGAAWRTR